MGALDSNGTGSIAREKLVRLVQFLQPACPDAKAEALLGQAGVLASEDTASLQSFLAWLYDEPSFCLDLQAYRLVLLERAAEQQRALDATLGELGALDAVLVDARLPHGSLGGAIS